MPDELEERLRSHAQAFDSLLSLIPAKLYYGEDVSDQWKRKKQTPEQKRAAKMAKLDPDNWKSAKDVMDERQAAYLKRKREEEGELSDSPLVEPEQPKTQLDDEHPKTKKRKTDTPQSPTLQAQDASNSIPETEADRVRRKQEQKAAKRERKKERKAKAKEKLERQKARKREVEIQKPAEEQSESKKSRIDRLPTTSNNNSKQPESVDDESDDDEAAEAIEIDKGDAFTNGTTILDDESSHGDSEHDLEIFSPQLDSETSSISSIQAPLPDETPKSESVPPPEPRQPTLPNNEVSQNLSSPSANAEFTSSEDARERLQARIQAFRAERKADDGPKSRAELLEQRRKQEERRRSDKKEQKRREREEAARKQEEDIAKRFSPGGSGSLLGSPRSPMIEADNNHFNFGRVAFGDGTTFDPANPSLMDSQKKKGPSDPATALQAAQAKQSRISGLDAEKRANIQDKDMWLNARKRASGEKVKDNTSLLKKALKRHEGQKKKSEKEWNERNVGIRKGIEMKQKKRTENLAKRHDEKGKKGKKSKVKRPGFEGSFRGRTGGGKKRPER